MGFGCGNITSSWTADTKTRIHSQTCTRPQRAADQIPTRRLKANLTFTSIEINETRGDCDVGAHI